MADDAAAAGAVCLIVVELVVAGAREGDQSWGLVEVAVWSIVLSGIIGTSGAADVSFPPMGLKIGDAGLSLAIQCAGRATSHSAANPAG